MPARNKYKYFKSNIRRRPNIFANQAGFRFPVIVAEVAELYEQLKTADDLPFWSITHNQLCTPLLVYHPNAHAACMLSIMHTLGACNKKLQKTNTKYEYESNIAQNPLANKYPQIRPNQILAFGFKYESNNIVFIQIRIKFQNALLFGCIWCIWMLHWREDGKRDSDLLDSRIE